MQTSHSTNSMTMSSKDKTPSPRMWEEARREARRALTCLFVDVREDIAQDVGQRIEAAFAADDELLASREQEIERLKGELEDLEHEDDTRALDVHERANAMMKKALGPEMYSRLWGPELERLGHVADAVLTHADHMELEHGRIRGALQNLWAESTEDFPSKDKLRRIVQDAISSPFPTAAVVKAIREVLDILDNDDLDVSFNPPTVAGLRRCFATLRTLGLGQERT